MAALVVNGVKFVEHRFPGLPSTYGVIRGGQVFRVAPENPRVKVKGQPWRADRFDGFGWEAISPDAFATAEAAGQAVLTYSK